MLMLEMTLYQLDRSTINGFGPEREVRANRVQVNKVTFTPSQGKSGTQLNVSANIRGTTGLPYVSTIVFQKVQTEPEDLPTNITVKGTDGQDIHLTSVSLNGSNVQVRCTCLDFYWRFAVWNHRKNSLYGPPPDPYVKTTERPPVNPSQKPGVCKHLYKLIQKLKGQGIMKNIDHSAPGDRAPWTEKGTAPIGNKPQQQMQQKARDPNAPRFQRVPAVKPQEPPGNPDNG